MPEFLTMSENYERGVSHGYDAAAYAETYGTTETTEEEAQRRAREQKSGDPEEYEAGFIEGATRYHDGYYADGTPREED